MKQFFFNFMTETIDICVHSLFLVWKNTKIRKFILNMKLQRFILKMGVNDLQKYEKALTKEG